jgi:hypothetical protein
LPEALLREAIEVAERITEEWGREKALTQLALCLAKLGSHEEALWIVQTIKKQWWRAEAIARVASHLPDPFFQKAIEIAWLIKGEQYRAPLLAYLATRSPEPRRSELLKEALEIARGLRYEQDHAKDHEELLLQFIVRGERKMPVQVRAEALTGLLPYLSEPLRSEVLQEALEAAQAIEWEEARVDALVRLAEYLPKSLVQEVLDEMTKRVGFPDRRFQAMPKLLSRLVKLGYAKEALEKTRKITHGWIQSIVLQELACCIPDSLLSEAVAIALADKYPGPRTLAMEGLAPRLSELLLREALETARLISDAEHQVEALVALVVCRINSARNSLRD